MSKEVDINKQICLCSLYNFVYSHKESYNASLKEAYVSSIDITYEDMKGKIEDVKKEEERITQQLLSFLLMQFLGKK
jgi:hypothetical protein